MFFGEIALLVDRTFLESMKEQQKSPFSRPMKFGKNAKTVDRVSTNKDLVKGILNNKKF